MAGLARRSLATLTTFVLLAGVGFTLGALAGILWEEPRLVLSYLTGGTTEIAWRGDAGPPPGSEAEGETLPDVAAAPSPIAPVELVPELPSPAPESVAPGRRDTKPPAPVPPTKLEPPPRPAPPTVVKKPAAARPAQTKSMRAQAAASKSIPKAPSAPGAAPASQRRFVIQVGAFGKSESAERLADQLSKKGYDAFVTPAAGGAKARWRVRVGPLPDKDSAEFWAGQLKKNEKLPTWILGQSSE